MRSVYPRLRVCYNRNVNDGRDIPGRFFSQIDCPSSMLRSISTRIILAGLAVALAGCGAPVSPTPQPTPPPGSTPTPTLAPTPTEAVVHLRLWMPESLAPIKEDTAANILRSHIEAFDSRQDAATVTVAAKKDAGPGGLLDLLRTAEPVAPAALPDVILLSDTDLAIAAREALIQPLDDRLDDQTENRLFPFARSATRIDGKRMGMPLVVDFNHVVFNPARFEKRPAAWSELISNTVPYPFSFVENDRVSDAVLADYQALGGTIIDVEGQPALTLDALTNLLIMYRDARAARVIAPASLEWDGPDDAWREFEASGAALTLVRASRYFATQDEGIHLEFGPAPAIADRVVLPIGRSWSLALVARDARRQALAVELVKHLTQAERAAAWTQAKQVFPASAEALQRWDPFGSYAIFARGQLNRALPPPSPAALEAVSPAFLAAIRDVLANRMTPQAAAAAAVEAVGGN